MSYSFIYLNEKIQNVYGRTGAIRNKGHYDRCKLFERYEHRSNSQITPDTLYLYKDDGKKNPVTLNVDDTYSNKRLVYEDVYFNKYQKNEFLVLVLHFSTQKARYFTHSDYNTYKNKSRNISELKEYNEEQFINILIQESDQTNETLTYQIEKRSGYNNISIQSNSDSPVDGFIKCTHTPQSGFADKICFVLYNNQPLFGQYQKVIGEIQNQKFTSVEVYFSDRINKPLLVCLIGTDEKKCYRHKTSGSNHYFQETEKRYEELTRERNKELIKILKDTEFVLLNTVQLLIDNKSTYKREEVQSKTGNVPTEAQPYEIVVYRKDDPCESLKDLSYLYCEHKLSFVDIDYLNVELKLFLSSNSGYKEIILYESDGNASEYLNYNKEYNYLFVYFYDQDPRPLLVCYGGNVYRPSSLSEYSTKWVKVNGLKDYVCRNTGDANPELLRTLHEVCLELNPVNLEERPTGNPKNKTYHLQTFKDKRVEIKVSYNDLTCYRRYKYEPNISGFRLGKLMYNGKEPKETKLSYDSSEVLLNVYGYYHAYDKTHGHLLFLKLELKREGNADKRKYFKLKNKGGEEWETASIKNEAEMEQEIYDIRKGLGIEFRNKDEYIFKPSSCSEYGLSTLEKIISGLVPTAGLSGGGITAYVFREPIGAFLKSLV